MSPPTPAKPRKRPLATDSEPSPKRTRAATAAPPEVIRVPDDEDPSPFHLTLRPHSKFEKFPQPLRNRLTSAYTKTVLAQMTALHTHKSPHKPYEYTLLIGSCTTASPTGAGMAITTTSTPSTPHRSIANIQLLELFVEKYGKEVGKGVFAELKTEEGEGMADRDFVRLHAVGTGGVSWGFSSNGCLSLFRVWREKRVLREVIYYVEQRDRMVKVEEIE